MGKDMGEDFFYPSASGSCQIHGIRWLPQGEVRAVVQIVHGIADHASRYAPFAQYLNQRGIAVVAEDHMGHGESVNGDGIQGYFHGGWFTAVEDIHRLMDMTRQVYPGIPYILFGHSMGSFLTRTLLCKYPDHGLTAAVICGTAWQPTALLPGIVKLTETVCRIDGETKPSEKLQGLTFGSYNRKVEHARTEFDWVSRDTRQVDAYIADPCCGFTATAGLLRDMMRGIQYIQQPENLAAMRKDLPIYFIAGGDDPVGNYGKGVRQAAKAFRHAGMEDVSVKIYPLCRHEILNEINRQDIFRDTADWMERQSAKTTEM